MERDGLNKSNPRSFSYRKIVRTAPLGRVIQRERDTQLPRMSLYVSTRAKIGVNQIQNSYMHPDAGKTEFRRGVRGEERRGGRLIFNEMSWCYGISRCLTR